MDDFINDPLLNEDNEELGTGGMEDDEDAIGINTDEEDDDNAANEENY